MDSLYDVFLDDEEPSAQAKAQAYAAALRRTGAAGALGMLTGDKVLGAFGQGLMGDAGRGEGALAAAGQERAGARLRQLLESRQQAFQSGEADKTRGFQAQEGRLNRAAHQDDLMLQLGAKQASDAAKRDAEKSEAGQKAGTELRKEMNQLPQTKSYQDVSAAWDKIQRVGVKPSAAGDMALIYAFMRLLDPTSGVKEGEFASASNAAGVPERIRAQANRVMNGERLTPEMRQDFLTQSRELYGAHESQFQSAAQRYRALAEKYGASPDDVAPPPAGEPAPRAAPAAATTASTTPPPVMMGPNGERFVLQADGNYAQE